MTWASVIYALWALVSIVALFLWLASWRRWHVGSWRVGRPSALLRDLLGGRTWLRAVVVLGWVWLGVHLFAR